MLSNSGSRMWETRREQSWVPVCGVQHALLSVWHLKGWAPLSPVQIDVLGMVLFWQVFKTSANAEWLQGCCRRSLCDCADGRWLDIFESDSWFGIPWGRGPSWSLIVGVLRRIQCLKWAPRIFDIGAPYSEKTWRVDEKTIKRTIKIWQLRVTVPKILLQANQNSLC